MRGRWNARCGLCSGDHVASWVAKEVMAVVIGEMDASIESSLSSKEARRLSDACVADVSLLVTVFSLVDSSVTDSRR